MKKITAAVVIINKDGDILGCHGTGKPHDTGFDFPKGIVEEGETCIDAALRELREETSFVLTADDLLDVGEFPHNREKNIHLFVHRTENMPDINSLECKSFFEVYDKQYPEVDFFQIISKKDRNKFNKVLQNKFQIIDDFNRKL